MADLGILSGLGSGLIGGIASLFGSANQNAQQKRAIKAQASENQKTRDYNLQLARMQNQWSIDQWNAENAYNTPAAQMARYRAAGLNPDLIYGQSNLSAASPAMTAGAAATSTDYSGLANIRNPLADAVPAAVETAAATASISKTKADTKKVIEDTVSTAFDNYVKGKTKDINVETAGLNLKILNNQYEGSKYIPKQMQQTVLNLQATGENLLQDISNKVATLQGIKLGNLAQRIANTYAHERNSLELRSLAEQCNLTRVQAHRVSSYLAYEIALAVSGTSANYASAALSRQLGLTEQERRNGVILNNGILSVDFDLRRNQLSISDTEVRRAANADRIRNSSEALRFVDGFLGWSTGLLGNVFSGLLK